MAQREACAPPRIGLHPESEEGGGEEVEDEADGIAKRIGHAGAHPPETQQVDAILYGGGGDTYDAKPQHLEEAGTTVSA